MRYYLNKQVDFYDTVRCQSESLSALVEKDDFYPYLKFYEAVHEIIYADPELVEKTRKLYGNNE